MRDARIIDFERRRDFSEKLNVTFSFAMQNFKGLFRSLLYIGGPPTLIASMLFSSFFTNFFSLTIRSSSDPDAVLNYFRSPNFWLQMGLGFVFFVTAVVVITA